MGRMVVFLFGVLSYALFFVTFLIAFAFVENIGLATTLDSAARGPLGTALLVDLILLGAFAVQHSGMARPAFKRWWTRMIPKPAERSAYVLITSVLLLLLVSFWHPLPGVVWDLSGTLAGTALFVISVAGWATVFFGTFMIDHFDLFGLRQVWLHLKGREYRHPEFTEKGFYRYVRHPLMLGFILAFWAAPVMSTSHLLFAVMTTSYILVALRFEEHDLLSYHGERYAEYRSRTPGLIPGMRRRSRRTG